MRYRQIVVNEANQPWADWQQTEHTYELDRTVLASKEPALTPVEWEQVQSAKTKRRIARSLPVVEMPVGDIIPTQRWVHRSVVDAMPDDVSKAREPIILFRKNGKFYLADGHHRLVAALRSKRTALRGRLLDFDLPHARRPAWPTTKM
jgi:hypothetical protein